MNLNCFTEAYHKLVEDSNKMNKAAYDMIYTSLNSVYEDKIIELDVLQCAKQSKAFNNGCNKTSQEIN